MYRFLSRWCVINIASVTYIRNALQQGPSPPAVLLRLSDGGHTENLGILPLLKLRGD